MKKFIENIIDAISMLFNFQVLHIEESEEDLIPDNETSLSLDCIIPDETEETLECNNTKGNINDYSNVLVILDCGHGKNTPGKRSPAALYSNIERQDLKLWEYKWNREEGILIADKLKSEGFNVVFTVDPTDDTDFGLSTRYKIANQYKSNNSDKKCIFISIHANAAKRGDKWYNARGWSVYTTKGQNNSDKLATELYYAAKDILVPLGQKMRQDLSDGDPDIEENFTVIYGANMPAVLTENLFYDNIEDTEFLLSDKGKEAIAEVHLRGIKSFITKYY